MQHIPHLDPSEQPQPQHPLKKIVSLVQRRLHLPQHKHSHLLQINERKDKILANEQKPT